MGLTLAFEKLPHLPPLSWCARVLRGGQVTVRHGSGVETRADGFVEGAWDGDFHAFDFDRAQSLAGSGGRLRAGAMIFAAPFHPLERIFSLRRDDEILLSNSLVFLLSEADDQLDIRHPHYFFDLLGSVRKGIAAPPARLRTAAGGEVELYPCCNLALDQRLGIQRIDKPCSTPPEDYAAYFRLLLATTQAIAQNAAAPQRLADYRLVAACSKGYDSTATAAVAALAGCREGVTYVQSAGVSGHPLSGVSEDQGDDSGTPALRALGMSVTEYRRTDIANLPGHPRAEFFFSPVSSTDASSRVMEEQLRGAVLVSGRHGERYWGPTSRCSRRNLAEVDDCHLSGHALAEFRLRTRFIHLPIPYIGALHGPAIHRITHSAEMRPWKLGSGYYDRPIARRIAEEAGVPREFFGQRKRGAGLTLKRLSAESQADFERFLETEVPADIRQTLDPRPISERLGAHRKLAYLRTQYAHWPLAGTALNLLHADRLHALWNSTSLYGFHWGYSKLQGRYRRE